MQELKRGDIRKVRATGKRGQVIKVESETVYFYTLADIEGLPLGRFKIEDLDYTNKQKCELWHENEEHGRQVNEDNHEHYYNR